MLVSIYGAHLGPATGCVGYADTQHRETPSPLIPDSTSVDTLIYPKELCGVQVLINGVAAGLLWVQEAQINFKVPQEAPVTGTGAIRVVYSGQSSAPARLPLGLETAVAELEIPAAVGMPVWLKITRRHLDRAIQYPFDILPANFKCNEVEVRRNGVPLPRIAAGLSQAFGGMAANGPPCGSLGLPADSKHVGRIPLHLQYRFDRPGTYEVRYTMHRDWLGRSAAPRMQTAWTRIEIRPAVAGERARWLAEQRAIAPSDATSLLTDFLPSILGIPDHESLALLVPFLYHSDDRVRRFAMYGLTFWPAAETASAVEEAMRTRGPSDVTVEFVSRFVPDRADAFVVAALADLRSDSPVLLRGAVTAVYRLKPSDAVRKKAEAALLDAADHVMRTADPQTMNDYICAVALAQDGRARDLLWSFIERSAEQAMIALTWRKDPADLPRLAQLTLASSTDADAGRKLSSLPYALYNAYGEAAVPYLKRMITESPFEAVRANAARELGHPRGPADRL
jgi:hypothetical protein